MILVRTRNAKALLERIHELILENAIPWEWSDGRLTLQEEEWNCAAGFAVKMMDSVLVFSMVPPDQDLVTQRAYAVYHARLIEDLITECSLKAETIHLTVRAAGGDDLDGREETNSLSALG